MDTTTPVRWTTPRVILSACVLGGIGLIGGIVVPMSRHPTATLGPLLGILVTGPLGVLVGGHLGVLWAAVARKQVASSDLVWLIILAALDLLFYEFFTVAPAATVYPLAAFLLTGVAAAVLRVYAKRNDVLVRPLAVASIAAPLFLVAALVPPVTANPYARRHAASAAHFRFLFSPDLDTSHQVPPLAINRAVLHLEWVAIVLLCTFGLQRRRTGPHAPCLRDRT